MGVVFGVIALVGWAVGDILVTKVTRKVGNVKTLFWQLVISFVLASFYLPRVLPVSDFRILLFSAALGVVLFIGTLAYFRALEIGNASLSGTISGAYPALIVILSLVIYQEKLTLRQIIGIILTIFGVMLVSLVLKEVKQLKIKKVFSDKGIKYSFVALAAFSLYLTLIKIPASQIGWFWQPFTYSFTFLILLVYSLIAKKSLALGKDIGIILPILLSAILLNGAHFAYNLGILKGFVSIIGPISGSQVALFVVLAQIFFREKMTRQQIMGVVVTFLGILLLCL